LSGLDGPIGLETRRELHRGNFIVFCVALFTGSWVGWDEDEDGIVCSDGKLTVA
jgi:hypothetical protein